MNNLKRMSRKCPKAKAKVISLAKLEIYFIAVESTKFGSFMSLKFFQESVKMAPAGVETHHHTPLAPPASPISQFILFPTMCVHLMYETFVGPPIPYPSDDGVNDQLTTQVIKTNKK